MLKLLNVDAAGERALRVVSYFDELAQHSPDLNVVVRSAAVIADCTAGAFVESLGPSVRYGPDGNVVADSPSVQKSNSLALESDTALGTESSVWLEREGPPAELDEFILERMALTVGGIVRRRDRSDGSAAATGLADPALAHLLVNDRADEAERSRAAQLLGVDLSSRLRVLAIATSMTKSESVVRLNTDLRTAWNAPVHMAQISRDLFLGIVLGRGVADWASATFDGRIGIGPLVETLDAPGSWRSARAALRLAGTTCALPRLLNADDVGSLQLLLAIEPEEALDNPDVRTIARIAERANGNDALDLIDHVVHSDSLRAAARMMNFHHSSLQGRVARIEDLLGFSIRSGAGRERASVALLLWRLHGLQPVDG